MVKTKAKKETKMISLIETRHNTLQLNFEEFLSLVQGLLVNDFLN